MTFRASLLILTSLFLFACQSQDTSSPKADEKPIIKSYDVSGTWRGVLASPGGELPFSIAIADNNGDLSATILNGKEEAETSSVIANNQNVQINFEVYDARIKATLSNDGKSMSGEWSKTAAKKISKLPFSATKDDKERFKNLHSKDDNLNVHGNWKVTFKDEDGESDAVAEFKQNGAQITGTFLTPTGDYRYLEGQADGNLIRLSTFDGAHAFLFDATLQHGELHGNFWSRDSYHATWTAIPNQNTADVLPDSWEMNQVTTEDKTVQFAFEDINGKLVQLTDPKFAGKAMIINLFGTWCPNCNDEAPVLARFYDQYQPQGLEVVGLAFEFTEDKERDQKQIKRFKDRHKINYPLLLAGINDKAEATKVLGFLDEVIAYPTSIFLDRNHKVVGIHTGFSGPGTGDHYKKLVKELEAKIQEIINS